MEEECVGGGGRGETVLQLHLPCDPPSTCTKSVETDLSMSDISDLHAEVGTLRRTVIQLDERLSHALKHSIQVCGHDRTHTLLTVRFNRAVITHMFYSVYYQLTIKRIMHGHKVVM